MTDREKYLIILDRFYRGRGASLLTKDESEALDYAISSIKTDLKYDLLYEETTHIADADKMIEPTTKNCESCRYYGLQQEVCNYCYKCSLWTEIKSTTKNDLAQERYQDLIEYFGDEKVAKTILESRKEFKAWLERLKWNVKRADELARELEQMKSTTKNDLGVDCISRADARSLICEIDRKHHVSGMSWKAFKDLYNGIDDIPSVTPQEPREGEWLRMSDLSEQEDDRYKCSRCGNVVHHKNEMDLYTFNSWCGRCGSDNNTPTIIEADKECEAKVITRGNCMMCGKELTEGLFFCKECEDKASKRK